MAVARRKQEDKHLKILRELVTLPHNKKCFDCSQRGPTYVNMTIGAFVCTSCSGLLRGLNPPHRIKSISMASFNSQEIEFLQNHGNDVCRDTWLALWDSPLAAEPESKDEHKVKDFLSRKYERKVWYSTRPKAKIPQQEPEAKPLKTLLGENTPQVIVAAHQEQKTAQVSPPGMNTTSVQKPAQPVAAPRPQESRSNMDLLGDLGGDVFATSSHQGSQNSFGNFQEPPPALNQQQQPLSFDAFSSSQQSTNSFDLFASSNAPQPSSGTNLFANTSSTDFFASSSGSSSSAVGPNVPACTGGDKYAAFSDLFSDNSTTQSVFSGSSVFSASSSVGSSNAPSNTKPNPFMSPGTQSSGAMVFQQQQQQQKPLNPFQNQTAMAPSQGFGMHNVAQQSQMNAAANATSMNSNWANNMQSQQSSNWSNGSANFNAGNQFSHQRTQNNFGNQPNAFGTQFSMQAANVTPNQTSNFNQTGNFGQPPNQAGNFGQPPKQAGNFGQTNFQSQSMGAFSMQQQPSVSSSPFGGQGQMFNGGQGQMFNQQQQIRQPFNQQPQQQQFAMQQSFTPKQNNFNAFGSQQPAQKKPPFGGVQMPGFGQQQQSTQQQQQFGSWGQPNQTPQVRSNNPFM